MTKYFGNVHLRVFPRVILIHIRSILSTEMRRERGNGALENRIGVGVWGQEQIVQVFLHWSSGGGGGAAVMRQLFSLPHPPRVTAHKRRIVVALYFFLFFLSFIKQKEK